MSRTTLAYVWSAVSVFLAFYAVNAWYADVNDGKTFLPLTLLDTRNGVAVLLALFVCPLAGLASIWLARRYDALYGGSSMASKLPVAAGLEIDPESTEGRAFQALSLGFLVLLPLLLQIHFLVQFFQRPAFDRVSCNEVSIFTDTSASDLFLGDSRNRYRYGDGESRADKCSGEQQAQGVTFFPFFEPLLIMLLAACYFAAVVSFLSELLVPLPKPGAREDPTVQQPGQNL